MNCRKVYGILMCQLAVTVGFIALFVYEPSVKMYSRHHPEMWWIAFVMTFVLLIVLACCNDFRRRWPLNIILLGLFTLCEGFMLGSVSSLYKVCLLSMDAGLTFPKTIFLTRFLFIFQRIFLCISPNISLKIPSIYPQCFLVISSKNFLRMFS